MNNFLEFINKDIEAKKLLITSMPIKTKSNVTKYNKTIDEYIEKYTEYKNSVKTYLLAKNHTLETKEKNRKNEEDNLLNLEQNRYLLNPTNTYFEKLGFDELLYQINNYNVFNFNSLNDIINTFLDKFELIGLKLDRESFKYNTFVYEYMSEFLDVRYGLTKKYEKVSKVFEKIYWVNPDLINHIGLNFRKLIRDNASKFEEYISKLKKSTMHEEGIANYEDCLDKLTNAYSKLNREKDLDIDRLVSLAINGELDINQYLEGNKVRESAFKSLLPENFDILNTKKFNDLCEILLKLKYNLDEYGNYLKFTPLFEQFKEEYSPLLEHKNNKSNVKATLDSILKKEKELYKVNSKLFNPKGLFGKRSESSLQLLKMKSNHLVRDLMELYKQYDKEYFNEIIIKNIHQDMTALNVLHLYYSFDYYKKDAIRRAYELQDYSSIIELSNEFDLYSMNPTNYIAEGIEVFNGGNVDEVIANKYKLSDINIEEADISEENLKALLNKVLLILRINIIENSKLNLNEVWFMVQVAKIIQKEKNENE